MNKVIRRVKQTRENCWEAFKSTVRLRGYEYYKPPPEVKYRYPAPGSVPQTPEDKPNLYKNHWKTSFKDSELNIRPKEIEYDLNDWERYQAVRGPTLDPN